MKTEMINKIAARMLAARVLVSGLTAAQAAVLRVTKTADPNDSACDSDCSLCKAMTVAAAGDRIVFASPLFDKK